MSCLAAQQRIVKTHHDDAEWTRRSSRWLSMYSVYIYNIYICVCVDVCTRVYTCIHAWSPAWMHTYTCLPSAITTWIVISICHSWHPECYHDKFPSSNAFLEIAPQSRFNGGYWRIKQTDVRLWDFNVKPSPLSLTPCAPFQGDHGVSDLCRIQKLWETAETSRAEVQFHSIPTSWCHRHCRNES